MVKKGKLAEKDISIKEILKNIEKSKKNKKEYLKKSLGLIKITKLEVDSIKRTEEKEQRELEKNQREQIRFLEKAKLLKKKNNKFNKFKIKFKNFFSKIKIKSIIEKEDKGFLKEFLLTTIISGLMVNYILFILIGSSFKWYGFPAYGMTFWLILNLFPKWTRKFWQGVLA